MNNNITNVNGLKYCKELTYFNGRNNKLENIKGIRIAIIGSRNFDNYELLANTLEDYKRRLKTITKKMGNGGNDITITRLGTKASCYRTFIFELEKVLANYNTEYN